VERVGEVVTGAATTRARIKELLMACIEAVDVDGGGISLVSPAGVGEPLCGSGVGAEEMERLQFTVGEGPCVDAIASGSPVLIDDLDAAAGTGLRERWAMFLPEIVKADIHAVFAFPIRIGAISLGVVDLYRRAPGRLEETSLAKILTTLDALAVMILHMDGNPDDGLSDGQLGSMAVHRAAGMIMAQLDTTIGAALLRLRAAAYVEGSPIDELARDVINRKRRFQKEKE